MAIKGQNLDSDLFSSFIADDNGSSVLTKIPTVEDLTSFLHINQEDALAKGTSSANVKKFFDYVPIHVLLPWLTAVTNRLNTTTSDGARILILPESYQEDGSVPEEDKPLRVIDAQVLSRYNGAVGRDGSTRVLIYNPRAKRLYYANSADILNVCTNGNTEESITILDLGAFVSMRERLAELELDGKAAADAAELAEKAAALANAAAQAANSKNTAGAIVELNKNRSIFLWYGTKAEYETQKDTLPENTECTIIDDVPQLVSATIYSETNEELDTQLKSVYDEMQDDTMRNIVVVDATGATVFGGGNVFLTLYKTSAAYGSITAIKYWGLGTPIEWKREVSSGTWHDWGWVNPPMGVGIEYRTTEMWNGNVVYTKLIDCGYLPNTTSKSIDLGISAANIVDFNVVANSSSNVAMKFPMLGAADSILARHYVEGTHLFFQTFADMSAYTAVCLIKYIKR